ncbi:MAG TPA: single-stranded-DNA-specific exonuclease RecJ [Anaerolineales bacterium]|nr:single-stranded-DNA-specific exonuclease RecJ [Anaerolineales bacterium]
MRPWIEPDAVQVPPELAEAVGGHPLVAQTLVRRGVREVASAREFLESHAFTPTDPGELPGLGTAVDRLEQAVRQGENICVWGDFDVDGQTATTLLVSTLRDLGARVSFHIPVRASESHGVNLPRLEQVIDQGAQLLLTCDTGIAAHEAVAYAGQRGVDVIITDHHSLPPELPSALAVVNPGLLAEGHPLGSLPGVGVAYKLAEALYSSAGRGLDCERHLDLVALGVVADLAILRGETRYLLQRGLQVLRSPQRLALQIMLELAELNPAWLTEEHIGFILAPRLNALGRLGDANPVVEFLLTDDPGRARITALQLEGLNAQRKLQTEQVYRAALAQLERNPELLEAATLVLAHPAWPTGVIGIVASRLVERYGKPAILLATPEGESGRGSARSVPGINITAAIASQRALLQGFGGHPMAAGLAIDAELIPEFARGVSAAVREQQVEAPLIAGLTVDSYMPLSALDLDLVADLERLAPFGPGNPPLVLASTGLRLVSQTKVGRSGEHLLLTVEDEAGISHRAIWWQGAEWLTQETLPEGRFDLAYTVRASTFRGQRDLQVEWLSARLEQVVSLDVKPERSPLQVIDYREQAYPLAVLQRLVAEQELLVWGEAQEQEKLSAQDRDGLVPAASLAIWTIPPGYAELQTALLKVEPQTVYLFKSDPGMDRPEPFLKRLAGLVKYALRARSGKVQLAELAAATAQSEAVVLVGLTWLEAQGHLRITHQDGDELWLEAGAGQPVVERGAVSAQLRAMLAETAAFRLFYSRADKDTLIALD